MASWADTQIPNFSPYTPQLPVEVISGVGMEKQRRYDEGVRKIQSSIDRIVGLDIMKDADKTYLQSKLSQLGKDLRAVAAGDFSNYQLVNSAAGMSSKLARDPKILNAVSSTAKYKRNEERIQKDIEDGKYNPANITHFRDRAEEWLNSKEAGERLNADYIPAIDLFESMKRIADSVGVDMTDIHNMMSVDEKGNVVWNDIMVKEKLKGKDAGKILKAFEMGLSPAELQQLAIEGEYNFRNYTPEMLQASIRNTSNQVIKFADERVAELKTEIYKEKNNNKKDAKKIESLEEQLSYFQKYSETQKRELANAIESVEANPKAAMASIYKNNYLLGMSKLFSSQEKSVNYEVSPYFTIMMQEKVHARNLQEDKMRHFRWEEEMKQKYGMVGNEPIALKELDTKELKEQWEGYQQSYFDLEDRLGGLNYELAITVYKETGDMLPGETYEAYERRMREKLYADSGGNLDEYTAKIAARQIDHWKDSGGIPQTWRALVEEQKNVLEELEVRRDEIDRVRDEAVERMKDKGLKLATPEEVAEYVGPTTVFYERGDGTRLPVNLSVEDLMDFVRINPQIRTVLGKLRGLSRLEQSESDDARKRLISKFGDDFDAINFSLLNTSRYGDISGLNASPHPQLYKVSELMGSVRQRKLDKEEVEVFKQSAHLQHTISIPILAGKEKVDDVERVISNMIGTKKSGLTSGFWGDKSVDPSVIKKALVRSDKNHINLVVMPAANIGSPQRYTLEFVDESGKKNTVEISQDDVKNLPVNVPAATQAKPRYMYPLEKRKTTNSLGKRSPEGAYFGNNDFKNFKHPDYNIKGDLEQDKLNPDVVHFIIYLHNKVTGEDETITYPNTFSKFDNRGRYDLTIPHVPEGINYSVIEQLREIK